MLPPTRTRIRFTVFPGRSRIKCECYGKCSTSTLKRQIHLPQWVNPAIGREVETVCSRCLEPEPARRYATAQEVVRDLRRLLARPEMKWVWTRAAYTVDDC